jgi:hypothetical protein
MARLIQIGSTFRPDDLLCGIRIGFCAGLLRFRLTARVLDRRSFFRAHGASRPARFQSEPGAPCVRELMRFGEARAPTRDRGVLPASLLVRCSAAPRRVDSTCGAACASPRSAVPVALRTVSYTVNRPSDDRATSRRRAGTVAQGTRYRRIHAPDACLSRAAAAPRAG